MRLPIRIQRRCTRGWKMPAHAKYVGRGSLYGNPFRIARSPLDIKYGGALLVATPAEVVEKYREWIKHTPEGGSSPSVRRGTSGASISCAGAASISLVTRMSS